MPQVCAPGSRLAGGLTAMTRDLDALGRRTAHGTYVPLELAGRLSLSPTPRCCSSCSCGLPPARAQPGKGSRWPAGVTIVAVPQTILDRDAVSRPGGFDRLRYASPVEV